MSEITKERFLSVYNGHPPSRFVVFIYKHFSKSGTNKDLVPKVKIAKIVAWVLGIAFLLGFIGTVVSDLSGKSLRTFIAVPTYIFAVTLLIVGLSMFSARSANNIRIRIIANLLNVSLVEYNKLADKYMET